MTQSKSSEPGGLEPAPSSVKLVEPTFYDEISRLVLDAGGVDEDEAKVLLRILSELERVADREGPRRAGEAAREIRAIWGREGAPAHRLEDIVSRLDTHRTPDPQPRRRGMAH